MAQPGIAKEVQTRIDRTATISNTETPGRTPNMTNILAPTTAEKTEMAERPWLTSAAKFIYDLPRSLRARGTGTTSYGIRETKIAAA